MGYSLNIGEAVVERSDEDGGQVRVAVVGMVCSNAPSFANEDVNALTNARWPSYTTWSDFAKATGLEAFFFDKEEGLIAKHPGAVYLLPKHATTLAETLVRYRGEHPKALPGFVLLESPWETPEEVAAQEKPPEGFYFDATLARLIWCEWWVRWALANCTVPIFENS